MHKAFKAQCLEIPVADVKTAFCPCPAHQETDAVFRVAVDDPEAFCGVDHGKEPQAPAELAAFRTLQQLPPEDPDKGFRRLFPLQSAAFLPALQRPGCSTTIVLLLSIT